MCPNPREEAAAHMLFECCHLAEVREWKWGEMIGTMPGAMPANAQTQNAVGKIDFILTGMNIKNVIAKWIEIYYNFLEFCHTIYCARKMENASIM